MTDGQQGFEMPNQTVFEQRMDSMAEEMREIRGAVSKMADALTKLSVLDERTAIFSQAVEKIAVRQDRIEQKIVAVELEQAKFESSVKGVGNAMKLMWGVFGGGVLYIGAEVVKQFAH